MKTYWFVFIVSLCLCFLSTEGQTIKYSSSCALQPCTSTSNSTCSSSPTCYSFLTSKNTTLCAPQVACSMFDLCISGTRCSSNTSVCILNSCCSAPICMPLALTSACANNSSSSSNVVTVATSPSSVRICSNATWNPNATTVISNTWSGSFIYYANDFYLDPNNNYIMSDSSGNRILQFAANNTSTFTVLGVTNATLSYQPQSLFVDGNGTIYTVETRWEMMPFMTYYYRVAKYVPGNGTTGTTIFGETICGQGLNQICNTGGIFVDKQGFIYYSDSNQHRILKITPFASTATLVAGTTGTYGSMTNQLYYPGGIYVDGNGTLYVADTSNYRLIMFPSGSQYGTVLFTSITYQGPTGVTLDNAGTIYITTNAGIQKWVPGTSSTLQTIVNSYMLGKRLCFDTYGNLYSNGVYMSYSIGRYDIATNTC